MNSRAVFIFMEMHSKQPIGIFDSGVGGTSIWKEIHELLPYEDTLYLADSKNAPYGNKSREEIISLSIKNTEFLLEQNCKNRYLIFMALLFYFNVLEGKVI